MTYFPAIGLLLGALVAGFDWAARDLWSPHITGALDTLWLAMLTRGLHLDGLADTADGIGSGQPPEKALSIMKDSTNGAFGVTALALALILKTVCFGELSGKGLLNWMIAVPCMSRCGLVTLATLSRYARPSGGLGAAFTGPATRGPAVIAAMTAATAGWFIAGLYGIIATALTLIFSAAAAGWFRKRLGGVTGDCLGAHLEITETLLLLFAAGL